MEELIEKQSYRLTQKQHSVCWKSHSWKDSYIGWFMCNAQNTA